MPWKYELDMNSSRTYEIIALAQKYQIDEYLSFNVF